MCIKKEIRAHDTELKFTKRSNGQKFLEYIGSNIFNLMPLYT